MNACALGADREAIRAMARPFGSEKRMLLAVRRDRSWMRLRRTRREGRAFGLGSIRADAAPRTQGRSAHPYPVLKTVVRRLRLHQILDDTREIMRVVVLRQVPGR